MDQWKTKFGTSNPGYNEWVSHLPLSAVDLLGVKTYKSELPDNYRPYYWWEFNKREFVKGF